MTMNGQLPDVALSVRQPWAWAIIAAGKNVENRSRFAIDKGNMRALVGRRIAIHAAKGMTRDEYSGFIRFYGGMKRRPLQTYPLTPNPDELLRGGIIGSVEVVDIARNAIDAMHSPWFFGPWALLISRPRACDFIGATGQLGAFSWKPNGEPPDAPARWMLPKAEAKRADKADLFGGA